MRNAVRIRSKKIPVFGKINQFKSKCRCGNWQKWGTTGLILDTVECSNCKNTIEIDFFDKNPD